MSRQAPNTFSIIRCTIIWAVHTLFHSFIIAPRKMSAWHIGSEVPNAQF